MTELDLFLNLKEELSKVLKQTRFEHSLGVSYTAYWLALKYGADPYKARIAGLLHDCAKYMSDEELIKFCLEKGIELTEEELNCPKVIHAKAGSYITEKVYMINDKEILNAVRCHCTGKPDMTLLEKIIFLSDFIEPNRKDIPGLKEIRDMAFTDLDKSVYNVLENTVKYLKGRNSFIVSDTIDAYNFYNERTNHVR